ncbi:MAG TPA: hypothetical protein VMV71_03725 [Candidatus Paceibacterota bacterium]|nr:hypothetical protein [Candidatus Paceibacterota bacterium]
MDLIELLKKLRALKADSGYTKESRAFILNSGKNEKITAGFLAKEMLSGIFRSGWSIALTAALLLLAIGGFSALRILYPITSSAVVDLTGLKAEAQAIDAQIELNGVQYDITGMENRSSTVRMALPAASNVSRKTDQAKPAESATSTESTSTPPTIDSVLNALSE